MSDDARIELTFRLWAAGAPDAFEDYVRHLTDLLPRHRGRLERRVEPIGESSHDPDAVLVMSFPDAPSVDGFFRDPLRSDSEQLTPRAISRCIISDSRHREPADDSAADVVSLHGDG